MSPVLQELKAEEKKGVADDRADEAEACEGDS
jgi:hypothetical protein